MLTSEQEEIARTLERMVPDRSAARRALEGGPKVDRELWGKLAELGLLGLTLPEALGGIGLGLGDECVVLETLAGQVAPVPLIPTYLAARILADGAGPAAARLSERLVSGEKIVGAALLAEGGDGRSILVADDDGATARLTGELAEVVEGAALDILLVPAEGAWWAVEVGGPGVQRSEIHSLDNTHAMARLELDSAPAEKAGTLDLERVLSVARTLMAAEALGVAQAALDLARTHSLDRHQFGQPIGRFQAIKQKLADCLIAVEGARSALWGAIRSAPESWPDPTAARLAKAEATGAAVQVVAESVQTHGAMGVTWEHDLHLLMRRGKHGQLTLGSPDSHLRAMGEVLMADSSSSGRRSGGGQPAGDGQDLGFQPTEEDQAFIAPFRAWLDEHLTPERLQEIRRGGLSARRAWQSFMAQAGWVGLHWATAYGGRDASFTQQILYYAELARRELPPLPGNRGLMLVGPTLIAHGTEEQKRLLEPTRRADILWSGGFSERGAGSDLASLRTKAVLDGDHFVVTGHKIWTSNAEIADWLYALVRTGPLQPKHDGISVLLIDMRTPGVEVRPIKRNSGDYAFNEVFFDDARVPAANLVGPLNEGWRVNRTTMVGEHLTNFLGSQTAQATTIRRITRALKEREERLGAPEPDLRKRLAEAWARTQIVKLHGLRNVARFTGGDNPGAEGSISKLVGQEHERRLFELMLDVQGVKGLYEGTWSKAYLSTRASTIGGGTSEIHRNRLAERVLGMPRDLWADEEQGAAAASD